MQSATWQRIRKATLKRAGYKCQYCGRRNCVLQVHHLTYERFGGKEKPRDLRVACEACHPIADNVRRYLKGLETFMSKKYGEQWQDAFTLQQAKVQFDTWLESKKE